MKRFILLAAITLFALASAFAQPGKMTGKLTYPSDAIPTDMILCVTVTSLYAEPTYCSNDGKARLQKAKIAFKLSYRAASYAIRLPAGAYYVYAMTSEMPDVKAYYDEFVRCGMSVECTSKERIVVKVKPGKTRTGITVGDFW